MNCPPPSVGCFRILLLIISALAIHAVSAAETLDRGIVALRTTNGVYVGWRLLAADSTTSGFHVFRSTSPEGAMKRITAQAVTAACNIVDEDAPAGPIWYSVARPGLTPEAAHAIAASEESFVRIKLQGNYRAQKVGLGDLNGDGRLDYIVKHPDFNTDP